MAITKTYLNSDMTALQTFLNDSGLFDSVTLDDSTVTCQDADGNTLVTFAKNGNQATVTLYASASVSQSISHQSAPFTYGYSCSNGLLLQSSSGNYAGYELITKTNNDKIAIVSSSTASATNAYAIAWGDAAPLSNFQYTENVRNQTIVCPFATNSAEGTVSYTPNAGFMPFGQYYNMGYGKIIIDGVTYLTNGHWVIKD